MNVPFEEPGGEIGVLQIDGLTGLVVADADHHPVGHGHVSRVDVAGEDVDHPGATQNQVRGFEPAGDANGAAQRLAAVSDAIRMERRGDLLVGAENAGAATFDLTAGGVKV